MEEFVKTVLFVILLFSLAGCAALIWVFAIIVWKAALNRWQV
jgi:hypothetical protein